MRIVMIGAGYVGLVSAACLSDFGHNVVCIDTDAAKIAALRRAEIPIFEPGLGEIVAGNLSAGRLSFTTDLKEGARGAQAIFIAVGTPTLPGDDHADLSDVYEAARRIGAVLDGYAVIVTKSTVPVGTGDEIERIIADASPSARFSIVSNPEFLREGSAIKDFKLPDRIVVGVEDERARHVMSEIYRPFYLNQGPVMFTGRRTAELIKYSANAYLAMKVTFINEISNLCEQVGADVQDVARGIGLDNRIGRKFLNAGPGFGGSCFPKDMLALATTARDARRAVAHHRDGDGCQRKAPGRDGRQDHPRLRRRGRRQDDRRSRADLQAEHRRYAQRAKPGHRAGLAGGRREGGGLRSEGRQIGARTAAGRRLRARPL